MNRYLKYFLAVLTLVLGACNIKGGHPRPKVSPTLTASNTADTALPSTCKPNSPPPQPSSQTAGGLQLTAQLDLPVGPTMGGLATFGHYLSWATVGKHSRGWWDGLVLCDLTNGDVRMIAKRSSPQGSLGSIGGSNESLLFLDITRGIVINGPPPKSPWKIYTIDLRTGKQREIASSAPEDEDWIPSPVIEGSWIAWVGSLHNSAFEVITYDLNSSKQRTVATNAHRGFLGVTGGHVYYQGGPDSDRIDVFEVPADGSGPPRQRTTSGGVVGLEAANGAVTWTQRSPTPAGQVPVDTGNYPLWWLARGSPKPIHFADGIDSFPGQGFVIWEQDARLLARNPLGSSDPLVLEDIEQTGRTVFPGAGFSIAADRVAWATFDPSAQQTSIHLVRIAKN